MKSQADIDVNVASLSREWLERSYVSIRQMKRESKKRGTNTAPNDILITQILLDTLTLNGVMARQGFIWNSSKMVAWIPW